MWFVFRPADCVVGAARFDTLNAIEAIGRVAMRGVLLTSGAATTDQARALSSLFGARFVVQEGNEERWRRYADEHGLVLPLLILTTDSSTTIVPSAELRTGTAAFRSVIGDSGALASQLRVRYLSSTDARHERAALMLTAAIHGSREAPLLQPQGLVSNGSDAAVYDFGDNRLKVFDKHGSAKWSYPTLGDSMPPVRGVIDIKAWRDSIGLLDVRGRVHILSGGKVVRTTRLPRKVLHFARLPSGDLLGEIGEGESLGVALFDSGGRVVRTAPFPADLKAIATLSREARVQALPSGEGLLLGFRNSSEILIANLQGGAYQRAGGIEALPFPSLVKITGRDGVMLIRVDPRASRGTIAIDADRDRIYALFAGKSGNAYRVIDVYDRRTLLYIMSYRLARIATDMARTRDGFVTIGVDPVTQAPELDYWRVQMAANP